MKISWESCYIQYCLQDDINFEDSNISCLSLLTRRRYSNGIRPGCATLEIYDPVFARINPRIVKKKRKISKKPSAKIPFPIIHTFDTNQLLPIPIRFDALFSQRSPANWHDYPLVKSVYKRERRSSSFDRDKRDNYHSSTPLFSLVRAEEVARDHQRFAPPLWIKHGFER